MGEAIEQMKAQRDAEEILRREAKQERMQLAVEQFNEVRELAKEHGIEVTQVGVGYRFTVLGYITDFYPSNQRVYKPNKAKMGPFIKMPQDRDWTLLDAVNAVIQAMEGCDG